MSAQSKQKPRLLLTLPSRPELLEKKCACGDSIAPFGEVEMDKWKWKCLACWSVTPHAQEIFAIRIGRVTE